MAQRTTAVRRPTGVARLSAAASRTAGRPRSPVVTAISVDANAPVAESCPADSSAAASSRVEANRSSGRFASSGQSRPERSGSPSGAGRRRGFLADDARQCLDRRPRKGPLACHHLLDDQSGRELSRSGSPRTARRLFGRCSPPSREPPSKRPGRSESRPGFRLQTPSPRATRQQTDGPGRNRGSCSVRPLRA